MPLSDKARRLLLERVNIALKDKVDYGAQVYIKKAKKESFDETDLTVFAIAIIGALVAEGYLIVKGKSRGA